MLSSIRSSFPLLFVRNKINLSNIVILFFAGLLVLLGQLKIFGLLEKNPYFSLSNPLFPFLPNGLVTFFAAAVEMGIGIWIISTLRYIMGAWLILWLSSGLFLYKLALALIKYEGPCGCLIGLTRIIPMTPQRQRLIASDLVAAMFVSSLLILLHHWWTHRHRKASLQVEADLAGKPLKGGKDVLKI